MKIPGGFYIKSRCAKKSWIAHAAPVVRETWDYLLREAGYIDRKYNGYEIKRGQLFINYKQIREDLHWMVGYRKQLYSENQMKHCMKLLTNNGMIELTNQPRGVIVTICNYDYFQNIKNYESTNESTINQPTNQPSINQASPTILKEGIKEGKKNDKKTIEINKDRENKFIEFWKTFPSRNGKKADKQLTIKKFNQLASDDIDLVMIAVVHYSNSEDIKKGIGIKNPTTWINNKCWLDWQEPDKPFDKNDTGDRETVSNLEEEEVKEEEIYRQKLEIFDNMTKTEQEQLINKAKYNLKQLDPGMFSGKHPEDIIIETIKLEAIKSL